MGKQKGDAARSKARPSSSSLAASLVPSGSTATVGFGGYVGGSGLDPSVAKEDSKPYLDVDSELALHLKRLSRKDPITNEQSLFSVLCDPVGTPKWNNDGFLTQKYRKIIRNIIKNVRFFLMAKEYRTFGAEDVMIKMGNRCLVTIKNSHLVADYFECRRRFVELVKAIFTPEDRMAHAESQDFIDHASSALEGKFIWLMYHPVLHSLNKRSTFPVDGINQLRRVYLRRKMTKNEFQKECRTKWGKKKIWPEHFPTGGDMIDQILRSVISDKNAYPCRDTEAAVRFTRNVLVHIEKMFKNKQGVQFLACVQSGGYLGLRDEVVKRLYAIFPQVWTILYAYVIDKGVDPSFGKNRVEKFKERPSTHVGSSSGGGSMDEDVGGVWETVTRKKKR